ncbi:MAG: amino acid-binding protein [Planctomycetaceae bacterium]|nr:amino acid-binding protein [Planctomycetaceae bacterium]
MNIQISRVAIWAAEIEDRPGGLAGTMEPLAEAGTDFEFVMARRAPDLQGGGEAMIAPVRGARQECAARSAGFRKSERLVALRVEASNRPGIGVAVTHALSEARISLRAFSGTSIGRRAVFYLIFDKQREAGRATRVLHEL